MRSPARSEAPPLEADAPRVLPASDSDVEFVAALGWNTFAQYGGSYDRYLADWFRDPCVETFVGYIGDEPRGFSMVAFYPDPERRERTISDLVSIAVAPESRSRGLGGALLDATIDASRDHRPPVDEMWLIVADGNARAARLFSDRGFRYGPGMGAYPAGQRALRMVRRMKDPRGPRRMKR